MIGIWIGGWIEIGCGIVCVLTLGRYCPNWDIRWAIRGAKKKCKEVL